MNDLQLAKEREKAFEGEELQEKACFSCKPGGGGGQVSRAKSLRRLPARLPAEWRERKGLNGGMEMNVTVLTTGFWPTYKVCCGTCSTCSTCCVACCTHLLCPSAGPRCAAAAVNAAAASNADPAASPWHPDGAVAALKRMPGAAPAAACITRSHVPLASRACLQQLELGLPDVMMQGVEQYTQVTRGYRLHGRAGGGHERIGGLPHSRQPPRWTHPLTPAAPAPTPNVCAVF